MMSNESIVCFAKDWTEDPTSNNHVMRLLARDNKVLWLNSIATRNPDFRSGGDLRKIRRKIQSMLEGPRQVDPGLTVHTPVVLPFPHSGLARAANRQLLRWSIASLRRRLGMGEFQTWTFLPTAVEYVGTLGEALSVYYCTDQWSQFSYVDRDRIVEMERQLCEKVDVVFTTSRGLLEEKSRHNRHAYLASHGVDHAHFSSALDEHVKVPGEIAHLKKPVIGFFGLVQDWIDIDLFAFLAERRPDWSIVIIGKALVDVSSLRRYPNITLIDRRPYSELPAFCKGFSVALCPFKVNELTVHVNPIKLREYLAAGLPVVATDIPECRLSADWCRVGRDHEEVLAHVEAALREDSPEARRRRSDAMKSETWERKVELLGDLVARVRDEKRAGRHAPRR